MNRKHSLLRDAIADTKTIKKVAMENAKASLEESFTPHLKDMLSKKIDEMDNDLEEEEEFFNEDLPLEENEEISIESLMRELEGDEPLNESEDGDEDDVEEAKEKEDKPKPKPAPKKDEADKKPAAPKKDDEGEEEEGEESEEEEDEEIDLENMGEEDLKSFIEEVIAAMVASGELEPGEGAEDDGMGELGDDDEINLEPDGMGMGDEMGMGMEDDNEVEEELPNFESQLFEAKKTISKLKGAFKAATQAQKELKEERIFNAKLLYANKILFKKNLKESQKVKVLKAFDKATSKNEAKMIYETLIVGVNDTPTSQRKNLQFASKTHQNPTRSKAPLTESKVIDSDPMVKYFRKMAFGEE